MARLSAVDCYRMPILSFLTFVAAGKSLVLISLVVLVVFFGSRLKPLLNVKYFIISK